MIARTLLPPVDLDAGICLLLLVAEFERGHGQREHVIFLSAP